jgi:hypothetical protein
MKEEEALVELSKTLNDNGVRFFVDVNGYRDTDGNVAALTDRLEHCGRNDTIRIGRRKPDLLGYNTDGEIFAVEVKGEKNIRKGIGQAAHYQSGVHQSYIAAAASAVDEFIDTILACGLGLHKLTANGTVVTKEPNQVISSTKLDKTRRALSAKTSDFEADRSAFSSSTMPLNVFRPLVVVVEAGDNNEITRTECQERIADHEYGVRKTTSNHAISLARTLQLVKRFNDGKPKLRATETGQLGYYTLLGRIEDLNRFAVGIDPNAVPETNLDRLLWYVKRIIDKRSKVYELDPAIGKFLRDRYAAVPNVRQLVNTLASYSGTTAELPRILADLALESPDSYLALFVEQGQNNEFTELMETSDADPTDRQFQESLLDIASGDYLYNFVSQLCHVGILTADTNVLHQEDDFERGAYRWVWNPDVVGDFAGEI